MRLACVFGLSVMALATLALSMVALVVLPPGAGDLHAQVETVELEVPRVVLRGVPFTVTVKNPSGAIAEGAPLTLRAGERAYEVTSAGAETAIEDVMLGEDTSLVLVGDAGATLATASVEPIPGWFAILPALVAIVVALALRQVIAALFLGIWLGAALVYGSIAGIWFGLLDVVTDYALNAFTDSGHGAIILFTLMVGGMVGIISKNGGTAGIVKAVTGWARTPRHGQLATGLLGVAIFFDDYANTLIVGNTMRPITDRLRISREKLSYLVDSTAAPVATIGLVTTWIGFQLGVIEGALQQVEGFNETPYSIFLSALPYYFYPFLTLLFLFMVAWFGRDFGPMLRAERRTRATGQVARSGAHTGESPAEAAEREPKPGKPVRALNALLPLIVLVVATFVGIYITGAKDAEPGASLRDIIGDGDSYQAMMWASLLAVLVAGVLSLVQGILTLGETVDAWFAGVRSMLLAVIILVLAWSLANVNEVLHAGDYLVSILGERLPPPLIPALVFVLSALTAFATGSSWGVMGIVMPLVVPLTWAVMAANGIAGDPAHMHIFYSAIAAVLAGAVWGDHCSPISDTTILSSLATECDHIDHVRTQLPYALVVGLVGLFAGILLVAYIYPWWVGMLASAALLTAVLFVFGRPVEQGEPVTPTEVRRAAAE
jgi:Na+/H+ antiporter NhaC